VCRMVQKSTREAAAAYVNDNTVANDAGGVGVDETGRQQMELEGFAIDNDGMPRVVASGAARDDVEFSAESVDNLALAFVAPLRAEHNSCTHLERDIPCWGSTCIFEREVEGCALRTGFAAAAAAAAAAAIPIAIGSCPSTHTRHTRRTHTPIQQHTN